MTVKQVDVCDSCKFTIAFYKCSVCGKSLCVGCCRIVIFDKTTNTIQLRFHKLTRDDEIIKPFYPIPLAPLFPGFVPAPKLSPYPTVTSSGTGTVTMTTKLVQGNHVKEPEEKPPFFCDDCVKKMCDTDANEEILEIIKQKIMIDNI